MFEHLSALFDLAQQSLPSSIIPELRILHEQTDKQDTISTTKDMKSTSIENTFM